MSPSSAVPDGDALRRSSGGPSAAGRPSLSIVFPCYNDAGTIASMVSAADEVAREATSDHEIIVVDDGSTDRSRDILRSLARHYDRLKLIFHERNTGYGGALRSGFAAASKDFVFYTDGDAQYDVFELLKLLPVVQDGVDVVNGYKIKRSDPWYRVVLGSTYRELMRLLFRFGVRDVDCDFRLMRRSALQSIDLKYNSGIICLELVKKLELAGYRFVDFPVHHYYRTYGRSQFFNVRRLARTAAGILQLWWDLMVRKTGTRPSAYGEPQPRSALPTKDRS